MYLYLIYKAAIHCPVLYTDWSCLKVNNNKLFKPKTESIKKKYVNSLKKSQSVRQNTGSSNSVKIELINKTEIDTTATSAINEERKNTDFSYKKKFEKEIDRCRRLKYEARYANLNIENKNQTIDRQAKKKQKNLKKLVGQFKAKESEKLAKELSEYEMWVDYLRDDRPMDDYDDLVAEECSYGWDDDYFFDDDYFDDGYNDHCDLEDYGDVESDPSFEDELIKSMIIPNTEHNDSVTQQSYDTKDDPCIVDIQKIMGSFLDEAMRAEDVDLDELYEETKNMRLVINAFNTQKRCK